MKQDNRCSAICLAHDVFALDYPAQASLNTLGYLADEAILVVPRCSDETTTWVKAVSEALHGRIKVVEAPTLPMDHKVPQRVWELGAVVASFPWLCQWDLAWGLPEMYGPWVKDIMSMPSIKLISFPIHELYGTPRWFVQSPIFRRCLIGHRSTNFRVETVEPPPLVGRAWKTWAEVQRPDEPYHKVDADRWEGYEMAILEVPAIDFGMVRKAEAVAVGLALDELRNFDVAAYADWHLPEGADYPFDMQGKVRSGMVAPYDHGEIPEAFQPWCDAHREEWLALDTQAQIAWEGRLL